jgi:hypothetical protein
MALTIRQERPIERPTVGRGPVEIDPEELREVAGLVVEASKMSEDKAMSLRIPEGDALRLVKLLRRAGDDAKLSIRFKTVPVMEDGKPKTTEKGVTVTTMIQEIEGKPKDRRIQFWTVRKIYRPRKANEQAQTPEVTVSESPAGGNSGDALAARADALMSERTDLVDKLLG